MIQAIAGVSPSQTHEQPIMTVWPSVSRYGLGQLLGRLYSIRFPDIYIFRVGNLLALLTIPVAMLLYAYRLVPSILGLPFHGGYYRVTNRRVMELRPEFNQRPGANLAPPVAVFAVVAGVVFGIAWWMDWIQGLGGFALTALVAAVLAGVGAFKVFLLACCDFRFGEVIKSVPLDRFDEIQIQVHPGQQWFHAGDLVFVKGQVETFRLAGVSRPQSFRSTCMKAHAVYIGVRRQAAQQAAAVAR